MQEADQRWINTVAQALQLMNSLFGPFTETYGIGRCAKVRPDQPRRVDLLGENMPQKTKWLYGGCCWMSHGWKQGEGVAPFRLKAALFM